MSSQLRQESKKRSPAASKAPEQPVGSKQVLINNLQHGEPKQTVTDPKAHLRAKGLSLNGTKQMLIDQVRHHKGEPKSKLTRAPSQAHASSAAAAPARHSPTRLTSAPNPHAAPHRVTTQPASKLTTDSLIWFLSVGGANSLLDRGPGLGLGQAQSRRVHNPPVAKNKSRPQLQPIPMVTTRVAAVPQKAKAVVPSVSRKNMEEDEREPEPQWLQGQEDEASDRNERAHKGEEGAEEKEEKTAQDEPNNDDDDQAEDLKNVSPFMTDKEKKFLLDAGLTENQAHHLDFKRLQSELGVLVKQLEDDCRQDWYFGCDDQIQLMFEMFGHYDSPLTAVDQVVTSPAISAHASADVIYSRCHEVLKTLRDSWNNLDSNPFRVDPNEALGDLCSTINKVGELEFRHPLGAIAYCWKRLLLASAAARPAPDQPRTVEAATMFRFIKDASDNGVKVEDLNAPDSDDDEEEQEKHKISLPAGEKRFAQLVACPQWRTLPCVMTKYEEKGIIDRRFDSDSDSDDSERSESRSDESEDDDDDVRPREDDDGSDDEEDRKRKRKRHRSDFLPMSYFM